MQTGDLFTSSGYCTVKTSGTQTSCSPTASPKVAPLSSLSPPRRRPVPPSVHRRRPSLPSLPDPAGGLSPCLAPAASLPADEDAGSSRSGHRRQGSGACAGTSDEAARWAALRLAPGAPPRELRLAAPAPRRRGRAASLRRLRERRLAGPAPPRRGSVAAGAPPPRRARSPAAGAPPRLAAPAPPRHARAPPRPGPPLQCLRRWREEMHICLAIWPVPNMPIAFASAVGGRFFTQIHCAGPIYEYAWRCWR